MNKSEESFFDTNTASSIEGCFCLCWNEIMKKEIFEHYSRKLGFLMNREEEEEEEVKHHISICFGLQIKPWYFKLNTFDFMGGGANAGVFFTYFIHQLGC